MASNLSGNGSLSGKGKLIFSSIIQGGNDNFQPLQVSSESDHHPSTFNYDGPLGKSWQCCEVYDEFAVGCRQDGEVAYHPDVYCREIMCFSLRRSLKWRCCGNLQRNANGCKPGPHPEQRLFFESLLPSKLLNRDQASLSSTVSQSEIVFMYS